MCSPEPEGARRASGSRFARPLFRSGVRPARSARFRALRLPLWLMAVAGVVAAPPLAQGASGQAESTGARARESVLQGRVLESGSLRPLAHVEIVAGSRTAVTDGEGRYRLVLPAGTREVTIRRIGFAPLTLPVGLVEEIIELDSRPLLLSAIPVEVEGRARLARGTSLAVETVEGDALHHQGHTSLAPALARAEGVSLAWTGSWGSRALLRGMGGERVAVLLDGNRVNRACVFGMDQGLATVDVAQVSRVEILSGPGSTLYGSGNVGGVVNVVSRQNELGTPLWGEARLSTGSAAPGASLGGTVGMTSGDLDWVASLDGASFQDYRTPDARIEGSSFRHLSADLKTGWMVAPGHRLEAAGQWYEGRDIGWPISSGSATIPEETRRGGSLDWSWQRSGVVDALSARGYMQRLDHYMTMSMRMMPGGMGGGMGGAPMTTTTDARSHSVTSGGRVQARLMPVGGVYVDLGGEVTHLSAEATRWTETQGGAGMAPPELILRSWPGVSILNTGLFAQGEIPVGSRLVFTGGARADHVDRDADTHPSATEWVASGNLGARLALGEHWAVRGTVGRGFRLPDATELFGAALRPDGFIYRGNPGLQTETGLSRELSLSWVRDRFDASATLFRNDLRDLIAPVAAPGEMISGRPVRTWGNLDRARYTGVSASLSWLASRRVTLGAQGAWTEGENRANGDPLPGVPPLEGGVTAHIHDLGIAEGWLELEGRGATRQDRHAAALGEPDTPAWAVLNLRGGLPLAGADLSMGVENLLDTAYRGHVDPSYTLMRPGRNLFLSVSRRF